MLFVTTRTIFFQTPPTRNSDWDQSFSTSRRLNYDEGRWNMKHETAAVLVAMKKKHIYWELVNKPKLNASTDAIFQLKMDVNV